MLISRGFQAEDSLQVRANSPIIAASLFPTESKIPSPFAGGLGRGSPDVTSPQRLALPRGESRRPLDSGFRRNDEGGPE